MKMKIGKWEEVNECSHERINQRCSDIQDFKEDSTLRQLKIS